MNLRHSALLAAIGVLLRGLYFTVANLLPSWAASEHTAQLTMLLNAVVAPVIWAWFFVAVWRGRGIQLPALLAALVTVLDMTVTVQRQYATFAALSIDTLGLLFGTLFPALCWILLLIQFARSRPRSRAASLYLVLVCLARFGLVLYEFVDSIPQIRAFWSIEPQLVGWRLIATPLIWMLYWTTQALFVRAAQSRMQ